MSRVYTNDAFAALCMLPSIVLGAAVIPPHPLLLWLLWGAISLFICVALYRVVVLMPLSVKVPASIRCAFFMLVQVVFWYALLK